VLASSLISSFVLYFLVSSEVEANFYSAHTKIQQTGEMLLPSLLITNFVVILFTCILTVAIVLLISHKIAGPLYKFEMIARQVGNGNLKVNTNLRRMDQLKDLSVAFSDMSTGLRKKISDIKVNTEQISENVEEALKELGENDTLDELKKRTQKLQESVDVFEI
jgi:methyl-accepting chemotaxis protein